ncbi:MAG TPA: hypothetical protein VMF52_00520 [Steroidobacteraceae bacterium]|nr:hypothetical protein [Steroidobacteraceae bacterium]
MKTKRGLFGILATLLCISFSSAHAAPGYRLVPLDDGTHGTMAFDLNQRGEVVGMRSVGGETHAFRWRDGVFTDLHDLIAPESTYSQAAGLNDRGAIVADSFDGESFRGFLLRGNQVSPINVVSGETQVFPFDINDRGQILVDSIVNGREDSFIVAGSNVQRLEGPPGGTDSTHAVAINDRGAVAGSTNTAAGTRAVLWQNGTAIDLGVTAGASSSFAYDLNDRNEVVGSVNIGGGSHAMHWRNGTMTLLPALPGEAASSPQAVNTWGAIVGSTIILEPQFRSTATAWLGRTVVELDGLVRADDPLKPYVHLTGAEQVNDRGDIVASGVDSRSGRQVVYFMTLFGN